MSCSSCYVVLVHHNKDIAPAGYHMIKFGVYKGDEALNSYTMKRYGPQCTPLFGEAFDISMKRLQEILEKPTLHLLKSCGDMCELVCGQKEHFWIKPENDKEFVKFIKKRIRRSFR